MTAKEIARNFWVWEDTKDRDMLQGMTWGQLKEFAEQLCREQRENCVTELEDEKDQEFWSYRVNNAPMPTL